MLVGSGIPHCLPQEIVNINGQGQLKAPPNDVWPRLVVLSSHPQVFLVWPWGILSVLISKILSHLALLCSGRSLWGMMMSTGPCFRPLTWFSFCHYWGTRTLTVGEAAFLAKVGRELILPALCTPLPRTVCLVFREAPPEPRSSFGPATLFSISSSLVHVAGKMTRHWPSFPLICLSHSWQSHKSTS